MTQRVLEHLGMRNIRRRGGCSRSRQLSASNRFAVQLAHLLWLDHYKEAQDHRLAIAPPRRRVHQTRSSECLPDHACDHIERVLAGANLDVPGRRATRAAELESNPVEPDNERARRLYDRLGYRDWGRGTVVDEWAERDENGNVLVLHRDECSYLVRSLAAR